MSAAAHTELAADHPKRKSVQQMAFLIGPVFRQKLIYIDLSKKQLPTAFLVINRSHLFHCV